MATRPGLLLRIPRRARGLGWAGPHRVGGAPAPLTAERPRGRCGGTAAVADRACRSRLPGAQRAARAAEPPGRPPRVRHPGRRRALARGDRPDVRFPAHAPALSVTPIPWSWHGRISALEGVPGQLSTAASASTAALCDRCVIRPRAFLRAFLDALRGGR